GSTGWTSASPTRCCGASVVGCGRRTSGTTCGRRIRIGTCSMAVGRSRRTSGRRLIFYSSKANEEVPASLVEVSPDSPLQLRPLLLVARVLQPPFSEFLFGHFAPESEHGVVARHRHAPSPADRVAPVSRPSLPQ